MADGNEVIVQDGAQVPQDYGEGLTFAQRVALDPSVDLDRLEKVIEMEVAGQARDAEKVFNQALSEMQPKLPAVDANGSGHNNIKYGRLEDIQAAIRPILSDHGFAVRFKVHDSERGLAVECILCHRDGHSDSDRITLPFDTSGKKNDVQARGSTVSYGKRYTLCNILNIQVGGEDNDANTPAPPVEKITETQENVLHALLIENNLDVKGFLNLNGIQTMAEIPAKDFDAAKQQVLRTIAKRTVQS